MIKRLHIILLITIFSVSFSRGGEWDHYFEQGNQAYRAGRYQEALNFYEKILDLGYASGELYFNMGNVCYKLQELGKARLYYERARLYLKNDEALEQNLQLLQMRLVDRIESPPRLILSVWWDALLNFLDIRLFTWLILILLWTSLLLTVLRLYFTRHGQPHRLRSTMMASWVVFVLLTLIFLQKIYRLESEDYAVILNPSVTLHSEPKSSSTEVFVLHEGTRVKVERSNEDWLEIKLEDGKTGWIPKQYLEII